MLVTSLLYVMHGKRMLSESKCSSTISSQVLVVVVLNFEERRPSSSWHLCHACSAAALTRRGRRRLSRKVARSSWGPLHGLRVCLIAMSEAKVLELGGVFAFVDA
uniref:Uncharacterized protein n=1 Tax=Triticum urartu TaxID=4572 RepID=A0A8R7UE30_TRIUA